MTEGVALCVVLGVCVVLGDIVPEGDELWLGLCVPVRVWVADCDRVCDSDADPLCVIDAVSDCDLVPDDEGVQVVLGLGEGEGVCDSVEL